MEQVAGEHYHGRMIGMLEAVWGEGFLSPGGPEEVARLVAGTDFVGRSVLDIGCGAGGIDIALVRNHGAGYVCGIDVEDTVLAHARALIGREGLGPGSAASRWRRGRCPSRPRPSTSSFPRIPSSTFPTRRR